MEYRRQVLRLGAAVIALAAAIRLVSAGFFTPILSVLQQPRVISFLMYMETGRAVRFAPQQTLPDAEPEPTVPPEQLHRPTIPQPILPAFSAEDLSLVQMHYGCNYRPELSALLTKPLCWDLTDGQPAVLILHSHATETYTGPDILYSGQYRTLQQQYNMVSIGAEIARVLEDGGITVVHDRTLHDYPDYTGSYSAARDTIARYLQQYPTIRMVLDIHRDASDTPTGQLTTSAIAGGQSSAQLMMVVGTDAGGGVHPGWQENLSLALKLTALLEQNNPGICRAIDLRTERFNMDLTPGSLLVEVGAAGDTHQQALIAANALAQGILELSHGTG